MNWGLVTSAYLTVLIMEGIRVGQNRKIAQSEKNPNCDKLNYHQQRGKNESHKIVVAAYASFI